MSNEIRVNPANIVSIVETLAKCCEQHPSDLMLHSQKPDDKGQIEMPMIMVTVPACRQLIAAVCAYHDLFERLITGDGAQLENKDMSLAEWEGTIEIMQRSLLQRDIDVDGASEADLDTPVKAEDDLELTVSGTTFRRMLEIVGVK